ncbi:TPA: PIN domain-containing protein [Vibrio alginolyticus]
MKNIYLDTSVFCRENFNVYSDSFTEFLELSNKLGFNIFTSEIVVNEIEGLVFENYSQLTKIQKNVYNSFNDIKDDGFDLSEQIEIVKNRANDNFLGIKETIEKFNILKLDEIYSKNVTNVFNDYFNSVGCFSDRKKNEFPDAFQFELIKNLLDKDVTYVVSNDNDFKNACKCYGYRYKSNLKEMIDDLRKINHNQSIHFNHIERFMIDFIINKERKQVYEIHSEIIFEAYSDKLRNLTKEEVISHLNELKRKGVISFYIYNSEYDYSESDELDPDKSFISIKH